MKKIIIFTIVLFSTLYLINVVQRGLVNYSPIEIGNNFSRREYLGSDLGRLYKNRFGLYYFDIIYPRLVKINSIFFSDMGSRVIYIPLTGTLLYFGIRKYHEKY